MALTTTEEAQTRALIEQNAALLSLAASEPTIISKLAATKASLSDLPPATVKNNTDLLLIRQGTEDKSITAELAGGDAAYVSYTPDGVGAVETTVQGKLRESVSVKDFGAFGDGATNDREAIQAALDTGKSVYIPSGSYKYDTSISFTSDNQRIYGNGNDSVLIQGAASAYLNSNGKSNIELSTLKVDGTVANGFFTINGSSSGVFVNNVYFLKGGQRVWLYACDSVEVSSCTFNNTGYGIIQQHGNSSSNVVVSNCLAFDMVADFVEANGAEIALSYRWTITNNIYKGSYGFPTPATENRFAGITSVEGVIITGNQVTNSAGDAAIHLEDILGNTIISNNVFKDCVPSGGNSGYIYVLNSAEDTIISNNIFMHGLDTVSACAYSQNSDYYSANVQFIGNQVRGTGAVRNFSGVRLDYSTAPTVVASNIFENVVNVVDFSAANEVSVCGNIVKTCTNGVFLRQTSSSSGGSNWLVSGNMFSDVSNIDIFTSTNSNGTNPPSYWNICGNTIANGITVTDLGAGGINSTINTRITGNFLSDAATITGAYPGSTNEIIAGNFQSRSILYQLSNYASDAAAATGGIAVQGLYRNGSLVQVRVV